MHPKILVDRLEAGWDALGLAPGQDSASLYMEVCISKHFVN